MPDFLTGIQNFYSLQQLENRTWTCGFCNHRVSSDRGYKVGESSDGAGPQRGGIYICPNCRGPTFFPPTGGMYPSTVYGSRVTHLPSDIGALYEEARRCTGENCFTAAVLLCRKILMNIAVFQGAATGLHFIEYVDFLSDKGYIPPNGKAWVDHIRKKGNEATHEILLMKAEDAKDILTFTEMLLKFDYEFPAMVGNSAASPTP